MRFLAVIPLYFLMAAVSGCAILSGPPAELTTDERLATFPVKNLPLEKTVHVRWNGYQIPYIEAETDNDAAFALGLVHAHLRLGQMEIMKRAALGRISEMFGPFTQKIDAALKTIGYDRGVDKSIALMPDDTKHWLDQFVKGVNFYKDNIPKKNLPHEFSAFDLSSEPFTIRDVLTLGRLFGTDVNWLAWFDLLPLSNDADFGEIYQKAVKNGSASTISFSLTHESAPAELKILADILSGMSKSGSNSIAVSGDKSLLKKPLIANDPHLGFMMPNAWLIAGLKCPSYHVVGMMPPGIPVMSFGRTPDIAWGGTNLRSLGSDLVNVESLDPDDFESETHVIKVRFWFDKTITVRITPYGPVITDAELVPNPAGKHLALRWIGHEPSDEVTALLKVMKATSFDAFLKALETFSIPAQNFLYADVNGNIGHAVSTFLPRRTKEHARHLFISPGESDKGWKTVLHTGELPHIINPEKGYIASSNNKPAETPYAIGYFFPPDERIRRLQELLGENQVLDKGTLMGIQSDTVSLNSLALAKWLDNAFRRRINEMGADAASALDAFASWDGSFKVDSATALGFVSFIENFGIRFYESIGKKGYFTQMRNRPQLLTIILNDLNVHERDIDFNDVGAALSRSDKIIKSGYTWGDVHRLSLKTAMGNIPLIGTLYNIGEYPVSGSLETVKKSAHPMTAEKHNASYGQQSRHVSDMSDPDENYFVLMGGNDGWLNSHNMNDQTPLILNGKYIRIPLTENEVAKAFPKDMVLTPGSH